MLHFILSLQMKMSQKPEAAESGGQGGVECLIRLLNTSLACLFFIF